MRANLYNLTTANRSNFFFFHFETEKKHELEKNRIEFFRKHFNKLLNRFFRGGEGKEGGEGSKTLFRVTKIRLTEIK